MSQTMLGLIWANQAIIVLLPNNEGKYDQLQNSYMSIYVFYASHCSKHFRCINLLATLP